MKKILSPIRLINTTYKQKGQASVLASYGIIIEYFSEGHYSLELFFKNYLLYFDLDRRSSYKIEGVIARHFHDHCYLGEIRKLEFVHAFHLENLVGSRDICRILQWKSQMHTIDMGEIINLRIKLKDGGLAMVIYPFTSVQYHCIVLGYDPDKNQFFKRDPVKKQIILEDFLLTKPITEYILFQN